MSEYTRGVRWGDANLGGCRTIVVHDSRGEMILECKMPEAYADEQTERCFWWWLDQHDDEREIITAIDEPTRPTLTVSEGGNRPRKSKKGEPAPPQLEIVH
jgi:hypothetical protein